MQSDPHADGFYHAMGARFTGESESGSIAGRMLRTFVLDLDDRVPPGPAPQPPPGPLPGTRRETMNLSHIDIISIPVHDQELALAFYRDVLGFEVLRDDTFHDGRWLQLGLSDAQTSITLVTWLDALPAGSAQGMVLVSADLEADHEHLLQHEADVSDVSAAPWGRSATFADPDGNRWVLQEESPGYGG